MKASTAIVQGHFAGLVMNVETASSSESEVVSDLRDHCGG